MSTRSAYQRVYFKKQTTLQISECPLDLHCNHFSGQ